MGLLKKAKDIFEYKKTKGTLVRAKYQSQADYIDVTLPDGKNRNLFKSVIARSAKSLSPNERKKVIADCEKQIDSLEGGNCPTVFREMLKELKYGEFEEDNQ